MFLCLFGISTFQPHHTLQLQL